MKFSVEKIEAMIYTIRGLRVMFDRELKENIEQLKKNTNFLFKIVFERLA